MTGPRRFEAMLASPRCGAKTRKGTPCSSPTVKGKRRCRMHGGAAGSGAPKGNRNALKHSFYAKVERERRQKEDRRFRELMKLFRQGSP